MLTPNYGQGGVQAYIPFDLNKHSSIFIQTIDRILSSIPVSQELYNWLNQVRNDTTYPIFWRDVSAEQPINRNSILPLHHPISENDLKALNMLRDSVPGFNFGPADPTRSGYAINVTLMASDQTRAEIRGILDRGGNPLTGQWKNPLADTPARSPSHSYRVVKMSELVALMQEGREDEVRKRIYGQYAEGPILVEAGSSIRPTRPSPVLLINDLPEEKPNERFHFDASARSLGRLDEKKTTAVASTTRVAGAFFQGLDESDKEILKSIMNFFLPVNSTENIMNKLNSGQSLNLLDIGEFAVDVVFSIAAFKALKGAVAAPGLIRMVASKEFRSAFARETAELFAENEAKMYAVRRIALRKMAAEPAKYARLAYDDAIDLALKESMPAVEKYGTKELGKTGRWLKSKGVIKGTTQTTARQALKSAAFGAIITDLSYETVKSTARAVQVLVSDEVPEWLEKENYLIAREPDPVKRRQMALEYVTNGLKVFWGIFKGVSWTVQGLQRIAPFIQKGVRLAQEGISDSDAIASFAKSFKADLSMMDEEATAAARNFWEVIKMVGRWLKPAPGSLPTTIGYSTMDVAIKVIGKQKSERLQTEAHGIATIEFLVPKNEYSGISVVDGSGRPLPASEQQKALEKNVLSTYESSVSVSRPEDGKRIEQKTFDMLAAAFSIPDFASIQAQPDFDEQAQALLDRYDAQVQAILDLSGLTFEEFKRINNNVFVPAAAIFGVNNDSGYETLRKIISCRQPDAATEQNLASLASHYYLNQYRLYFDAYSLAHLWLSSPDAMRNQLSGLPGAASFEKEWNSVVLQGQMPSELHSTIPFSLGADGQHARAMYVIFKYTLMSILPHGILENAPVYTGGAKRGKQGRD